MKLSLSVVLVVLAGCPKPQPPLDPSDPNATCATACQNVAEMRCKGWTTPKGGTCEEVCGLAAEAAAVAWPVGCLSAARSCDDADRCR